MAHRASLPPIHCRVPSSGAPEAAQLARMSAASLRAVCRRISLNQWPCRVDPGSGRSHRSVLILHSVERKGVFRYFVQIFRFLLVFTSKVIPTYVSSNYWNNSWMILTCLFLFIVRRSSIRYFHYLFLLLLESDGKNLAIILKRFANLHPVTTF